MRGGVIAAIAVDALGLTAGVTPLPPDRRDRCDQRYQWGDIMRVRPRHEGGQGDALGCRHEVMLAPQLPSIRRMRARLSPP